MNLSCTDCFSCPDWETCQGRDAENEVEDILEEGFTEHDWYAFSDLG